ncbi:MAG: metallopeptidase family protein [Kiritimatiellaeota bacterium]|nr:metallopeptidase family protein [Kiritimatiellota bacterium]
MSALQHDPQHWSHLTQAAQQEVEGVLATLPQDVRERLSELPITFDPKPNAAMLANGIDADRTLGLFTGVSYARAIEVSQRLPPQIILFLENIFKYARSDGLDFRTQVRRTLLHEIGHYLGLDEDGVDQRGL